MSTAEAIFENEVGDIIRKANQLATHYVTLSETSPEETLANKNLANLFQALDEDMKLLLRLSSVIINFMSIKDSTVEEANKYFAHASRVAWESSKGLIPETPMSLHLHKIASDIQVDAAVREREIGDIIAFLGKCRLSTMSSIFQILNLIRYEPANKDTAEMVEFIQHAIKVNSKTLETFEFSVHECTMKLDEKRLNAEEEYLHSSGFHALRELYYASSTEELYFMLEVL